MHPPVSNPVPLESHTAGTDSGPSDDASSITNVIPADYKEYICDENQIKKLFSSFMDNNVSFGNSPYVELIFPSNTLTDVDAKTGRFNKPDMKFNFAFLRSRLFNAFDPVAYWKLCTDKPLSADVQAFLDQYALRVTTVTTDADGYRLTVPASDANSIILVVGDSVAFGGGIDDEDTISSQMQAKYPYFKFINAGVPGAQSFDALERLKESLGRFGNRIKGVVYVHCENDFISASAYTPAQLVSELSFILDAHSVRYRVLVYQEYIYGTMPDIARNRTDEELLNLKRLKEETLALAAQRGVAVVDFYDIVNMRRTQSGCPLGGFELYIDHCHFSPEGVRMVVDAVPPPEEN
ncbi:MAG: SGNH/GDSL hydrolase family protein [Candidatus Auribacter fodinae]|jgi:hypothetical protein|uniref:SGNH/GDSL hydrolase family protein n=1 Tax=Candidatus Auribacter fodinae TaxID=2093366 RepID=A0A3A4QYI4_9BACT|nr:MAG: SGNH/GDSL hydrolase family protein [Candidatus Auribacter fodinae]